MAFLSKCLREVRALHGEGESDPDAERRTYFLKQRCNELGVQEHCERAGASTDLIARKIPDAIEAAP